MGTAAALRLQLQSKREELDALHEAAQQQREAHDIALAIARREQRFVALALRAWLVRPELPPPTIVTEKKRGLRARLERYSSSGSSSAAPVASPKLPSLPSIAKRNWPRPW